MRRCTKNVVSYISSLKGVRVRLFKDEHNDRAP